MADIKSSKWRLENGVTDREAERKLDEAVRIIRSQGSLYPILAHLNADHFRSAIENKNLHMDIETPGGIARKRFDPDYMCFTRFVITTLLYVRDMHPDAQKVDFMVERNGPITRHIERFHASIEKTLRRELGRADLADLVGELIPGSKEQVPLQAADLFCWYVRNASGLRPEDRRRLHAMIDRPGYATRTSEKEVDEFAKRASVADDSDASPDFEGVRGPTTRP